MINKLCSFIRSLGFIIVGLGSQAAYSQNLNLGPQKTAVIAVKFSATDPDPLPVAKIRDIIFNSATLNSLNAYVKEVSYNQSSIAGGTSGDVFGWYTLNMSSTCDWLFGGETVLPVSPTPTNLGTPVLAAAIAAADPFIDFRDYRRIILFQPPGTCIPMGIGNVTVNTADGPINASVVWTAGYYGALNDFQFGMLLQHEGGHGFGLEHAQAYECGAQAFAASGCNNSGPPADPFDRMGLYSLIYSAHYNAFYKEKIGWLNSTNVFNVTTSGTYTILPLESTTAGYKAIKIPRPNNPTQEAFYIEYRQPNIGVYDNALPGNAYQGALIRYVPSLQITQSMLIDTTPESMVSSSDPSLDFQDAALIPGRTFDGPGFTVRTASATSSGLTVNVCTDPISIVTTDGSGESASVNATLKLEFIGKISNLVVGSKVTTFKVCQGNLLNYKAIVTAGTPVCTIDNRVVASQGVMSVESLRKLYCTNTQGGGSDKDSFSISPI